MTPAHGAWGRLGFSFVSPDAARAWVHRYYNNLLHRPNRLAEYPANPNIAIVNGFMCAPTDEEAIAAASGWTFFIFALGYYGRKGIDAPGTGNLWREYQDWRQTDKAKQASRNGLIGSPDTIRKRLRQFEEAHVDQVILLNQAGRTSHQAICDSLDLFAREVMPEFHARQPAAGRVEGGRAGGPHRAGGTRDRRPRPLRASERGYRPIDAGTAQAAHGGEGEGCAGSLRPHVRDHCRDKAGTFRSADAESFGA